MQEVATTAVKSSVETARSFSHENYAEAWRRLLKDSREAAADDGA